MLQLNHFDSRLSDSLSPDLQKVKKGRQNSVVRRSQFDPLWFCFVNMRCTHRCIPQGLRALTGYKWKLDPRRYPLATLPLLTISPSSSFPPPPSPLPTVLARQAGRASYQAL